ncbi:MAG: nitronate monooxygenase [Flavobacteriales bacterium]|nr:nitronate monooxygenase [Flavobacteriales bacterium]MBK7618008.1 nitronate monooxygenase [Flavobacteriales bacterium]
MRTRLTEMLQLEHPLIMAPMFLVSNVAMVIEGMRCGVAGCIPALNYRTIEELRAAARELKVAKAEYGKGAFGFNLIVNKSNPKAAKQLDALCEEGCDFLITSLGSPEETIKHAHAVGIKVFCDVTDLRFAQKVEAQGADAVIAVNNEAGGHRGELSPKELIELLRANCTIPVISAGGVGNKAELDQMLDFGAEGVSVGSPFIAAVEAPITDAYKQACVDFGADDIVLTERISGTPCTVINTPYMQKIGTRSPWLERMLNKNRRLKKWVKMLRFYIGMKATEQAAQQATYKTVWVAGPSIGHTKAVEPVAAIIGRLVG